MHRPPDAVVAADKSIRVMYAGYSPKGAAKGHRKEGRALQGGVDDRLKGECKAHRTQAGERNEKQIGKQEKFVLYKNSNHRDSIL